MVILTPLYIVLTNLATDQIAEKQEQPPHPLIHTPVPEQKECIFTHLIDLGKTNCYSEALCQKQQLVIPKLIGILFIHI